MYTVEQQRKRRANIKSPGFVFAVDMMWYATQAQMRCREVGVGTGVPPTSSRGKADDGDEARLNVNGRNGVIDKGAFVSLMVKVHYLIISPPVSVSKGTCTKTTLASKESGVSAHAWGIQPFRTWFVLHLDRSPKVENVRAVDSWVAFVMSVCCSGQGRDSNKGKVSGLPNALQK